MATKKYLLYVEVRYHVIPKSDYHTERVSDKITIGLYDDKETAFGIGNDVVKHIREKYGFEHLKNFTDKNYGKSDIAADFSSHDVSVICNIEDLVFDDLDTIIDAAFVSDNKYKAW